MNQTEKQFKKQREVSNTILDQLGAMRFITMMGAKNIHSHRYGISFNIGRNCTSTNYVVIALEANDTYTMSFMKSWINRKTCEHKIKVNAEFKGVYADKLRDIFTQATGMQTSL